MTPLRDSARTYLLVATSFIDSGIAVAAGPILGLQSQVISIPSGYHLALYQLLFLLPQLVSTQVVEHLSTGANTLFCLVMTLLFSSLAMYVQYISFSFHALSIFFLSRLLTGLFRHEKMLFQKAGAQNPTVKALLPYTSWLGLLTGLVVGGVAGDVLQNPITIVHYHIMIECLATLLAMMAFLLGPREAPVEVKKTYYSDWLRAKFEGIRADKTRVAIASLVLVTLSCAVNQCMYPLDSTHFEVSFFATAAHMAFSVVIATSIAPRVLRMVPLSEKNLRVACCVVFFVGCHFIPSTEPYGIAFYVAYSSVLIDLPSGVLTQSLSREIINKDASQLNDMTTKFVSHLILVPKLFGAPFRMCLTAYLRNSHSSVCAISCPCVTFVLVAVMTQRLPYAVAAGVAVCSLYLSSHYTLS